MPGARESGVDERVVLILRVVVARVRDVLLRDHRIGAAQEDLDLARPRCDALVVHVEAAEIGVEEARVGDHVHDAEIQLHRVGDSVHEVDARRRGHRDVRHGIGVTAEARQRQRAHQARPQGVHRSLD